MIVNKQAFLRSAGLLALTLVLLSGCGRNAPSPTPGPASMAPFSREELPPDEAVVEVRADAGGTIALEDGAQVTLPPGSLAQDATVTLRTALDTPAAAIPASILGQAYELVIDGAEMTGVALARLPLPPGVTVDQYQVAPYRWTGRLWERVTARDGAGGIQIGINEPGLFALLGQWRHADASLALVKPDTLPGQQSIPLTVVGQYRFSATPALQDDLVPANVILKQDSSGGAGLIAGDPSLDVTVDETTLYFKPDPAQSQGLIQFTHLFEVLPGLLRLDPGVSTRFYAVLSVEDSAAPTRRLSSGVEYTQILPIQLQNTTVVRPLLQEEERLALRWRVMLNGLTFQTPAAAGPELALQPIIDQGGVGAYSIVLEAQTDGEWLPISNEVTVELAVRSTPTLQPGQASPTPALVAIATPGPAIPTPAVPTRRPAPAGGLQLTATPSVSPTPTVELTPSPTRLDWANVFRADRYIVAPGECVSLSWQIDNVITVLFEGQPATGAETRQVCPNQSTTYTLRVTSGAGTQDYTVTIQVSSVSQPAITFTADTLQIAAGSCATLSWTATNVKEVRLNGVGVAGVASQQVCPTQTTDYELLVVDGNGQTTTKLLTIVVSQTGSTAGTTMFWAEQYTLAVGACTTLHWRVENVQAVHLDGEAVTGSGTKQVCPINTQFYTLDITDAAGAAVIKELELLAGEPYLAANEIIAQGVVNQVTRLDDIDPSDPGALAGYAIVIDGIRLLNSGIAGYNQGNVTLRLPQAAIDLGDNGPVHWPIRTGQQVEFRAACDGATCVFDYSTLHYLYWRSQ